MTNEELIGLAVKADLCDEYGIVNYEYGYLDEILAFGKLVAEREREASAKELDEISKEAKNVAPNGYVWRTIKECAEAIRARGEA